MKAYITAIYKKELRSLSENYRPISITSVISKIMESTVGDGIVAHLMKHKLLTDDQHGFVPGRNCMSQLLLCMEDWTKRRNIWLIYTYFAKAFDSVAHERLLLKLERVSIKGDLLKWIRTFLCGRTQCICVEGVRLKWKKVISGIPQGSVIGLIIFIINDMSEEVKHSICKLFADDCKLYYRLNPAYENKLQIDRTNREKWSKRWQLPFNASKCKVMHFGHNNQRHEYHLDDHQMDNQKDLVQGGGGGGIELVLTSWWWLDLFSRDLQGSIWYQEVGVLRPHLFTRKYFLVFLGDRF